MTARCSIILALLLAAGPGRGEELLPSGSGRLEVHLTSTPAGVVASVPGPRRAAWQLGPHPSASEFAPLADFLAADEAAGPLTIVADSQVPLDVLWSLREVLLGRGLSVASTRVTAVADPEPSAPWGVFDYGFEVQVLTWSEGTEWTWGFTSAFGLRLWKELYLKLKGVFPLPLGYAIGDQATIGLELEYAILAPVSELGFAVSAVGGMGWNWWWNRHALYLGDLDDASRRASGPRLWTHARFGVLVGPGGGLFADIGLDGRWLEVSDDGGRRRWRGFIGPHLGLVLVARF